MVPPLSLRIPRARRYSGYRRLLQPFAYEALTLSRSVSHRIRLNIRNSLCGPYPGLITESGLASSAFARHYLRNLVWFLFLCLLRCFTSAGSPPVPMYSVQDSWFFIMRVSPFGNLRVVAYLQLTAAYRSLSRPSSAPDAKAFTLRSYSLELLSLSRYSVLLNCLSFSKHLGFFFFAYRIKRFSFFVLVLSPLGEIFTSRWIVVYPNRKDQSFLDLAFWFQSPEP